MAVSSDSLRLAVVEEATVGVIPNSPTYDLLRITGEGLTYEVNTQQSGEMGGINRGVKDLLVTGAQVTGNIEFELTKHAAMEKLMAAVLGNDWAADPLSNPITGADVVYDYQTRRTFAFEKRFTLDEAPTYSYHRFVGCLANTMTLSITPNEPITGSFDFIGNAMTTENAEVAGSTYNLAGSNPVMTAPLVTGIEVLTPIGIDNGTGAVNGTPVGWTTAACFTSLELTIGNNARGLQCIGTLGNKETVLGQLSVTGTGNLYYAADDPLDALVNKTEYALRVTCADEDGNSFQFLFPRMQFSSAQALATGTNSDVMTEVGLQMLEYTGDDYAFTAAITRG